MTSKVNVVALMTRDAFARALAISKPGTDITYHVGSLCDDRTFGPNFLAVHGLGLTAWKAMEEGKVNLFQRRVGSVSYYIARVKPAPHTPVHWEGCYSRDYSHLSDRRAA